MDKPCVDVWTLPLVVSPCDADAFAAALTAQEEELLGRIASAPRRERTRVAWATRRALLGRALGCAPADVVIVRPPRGAPTLDMPGRALHFSLSHSADAMLFALSARARVGADIEWIDDQVRVDRLARRFFSADEAGEIASLEPLQARGRFFRLWTRKEAVLKALGGGVPSRLRTVPLATLRERDLLAIGDTAWSLHDVPAPAGYAAAVAVEGEAVVRIHRHIDVPGDETG